MDGWSPLMKLLIRLLQNRHCKFKFLSLIGQNDRLNDHEAAERITSSS